MLSRVHLAFHAQIQDFSSVGGGPGQSDKKALTTFFFLVLSLFYLSQMVNFEENSFFKVLEGVQHFPGGSNFSQGVQLLIPYRNPYNL